MERNTQIPKDDIKVSFFSKSIEKGRRLIERVSVKKAMGSIAAVATLGAGVALAESTISSVKNDCDIQQGDYCPPTTDGDGSVVNPTFPDKGTSTTVGETTTSSVWTSDPTTTVIVTSIPATTVVETTVSSTVPPTVPQTTAVVPPQSRS